MAPKRILYADDDADLRRIVKDQLVMMGFVIDEAEDGNAATEQLQKEAYDLILLDINMPGKSGIDVLKFLKDSGGKCRVIMLTGRVGFSVATETLKLGADAYITKPFNLEYLVSTINKVLAT
jgi:DNA-binding response OmpR family regulator